MVVLAKGNHVSISTLSIAGLAHGQMLIPSFHSEKAYRDDTDSDRTPHLTVLETCSAAASLTTPQISPALSLLISIALLNCMSAGFRHVQT
jgi:hypothetical protein